MCVLSWGLKPGAQAHKLGKYFSTELQSKSWTPQFYLLDVTQMFTMFLYLSTFLPLSQKAAMSAPFIKVLFTLFYISLPSGKIQPQRRIKTTFQLKSMGWTGSWVGFRWRANSESGLCGRRMPTADPEVFEGSTQWQMTKMTGSNYNLTHTKIWITMFMYHKTFYSNFNI